MLKESVVEEFPLCEKILSSHLTVGHFEDQVGVWFLVDVV